MTERSHLEEARVETRIRPAEKEDVHPCGEIMYEAFKGIAEAHNFPPVFPDADPPIRQLDMMQEAANFDGFVAEEDGAPIGSIWMSRRSPVAGISALTVDPNSQDRGVGGALMKHAMSYLEEHGHARLQLIQSAYHNRSLCLYTKLGFVATDLLSHMTNGPVNAEVPGRTVRQAMEDDAAACNDLCREVHGFHRSGEVEEAIRQDSALVVEDGDEITGYSTGVGFTGHGVGHSNEDLKALIASVDDFAGPGIIIPTSNYELFSWCLENGLRLDRQFTLMDTDPSDRSVEPAYWPGILC